MKRRMLSVGVMLLCASGAITAQEKRTTTKETEAHLGVAVAAIPEALSSQLPGILAKGQGVLVGRVEKGSPAEKAGLKPNDVLLSYGDQKLSSPEQLVKLVRGDKAGHEVTLDFVRGGKQMSCKVQLGEAEHQTLTGPRIFRVLPPENSRKAFEDLESRNDATFWDSFDAMKLTRTGEKQWRAEIEYRNKEGKKETKTFNGSRDEIRNAINADKDLPANEQRHLLRALNLQDPVFEFHFPGDGQLP